MPVDPDELAARVKRYRLAACDALIAGAVVSRRLHPATLLTGHDSAFSAPISAAQIAEDRAFIMRHSTELMEDIDRDVAWFQEQLAEGEHDDTHYH